MAKVLKFINGRKFEITPFHKLWNGKEVPYGKVGDDGLFHINYHATMDGYDGGYEMLPIYAVDYYTHYVDFECKFDVQKCGKDNVCNFLNDEMNRKYTNEEIADDYYTVSVGYVKYHYEYEKDSLVNNHLKELGDIFDKFSIPSDSYEITMKNDDRNKLYHIFIGEAPHKDENGRWITYNEVPNFVVGAFGGVRFIDDNISKPHFIRMTVEKFNQERENTRDENDKNINTKIYNLEHPTYTDLFKQLGNKIKKTISYFVKRYLGCFIYVNGKHCRLFKYYFSKFST